VTSHDRLGSELAGYRIDSVIGRGGMSVVYLAEEVHLDRKVALKLLSPELGGDAKFRERFIRESRLAASLEHPNIITVYEARDIEGQLYIAMRYIAGGDLKSLIAREGPLDAERTISILSQAASALDAAHREGLIHRDIKPGNILLNPRSEKSRADRVYLSDFGLTKRATSDSGITATGQFVGTLDYAAPEQFEGKPLDARTDVYSLGCVLYECLTGEVPFTRDNEAALVYAHLMAIPPKVTNKRPDLPSVIDAVMVKAMAKQREDRYPTAGELVQGAAEALRVQPVIPTAATLPPPTGGRRSRTKTLLAVIGAAVLIVGFVAAFVLASRDGEAPGPGSSNPAAAALVDYVARVDPATGTVVGRIHVGKDPLAVAVGEGSAWVVNSGDGTVSRIDPASRKVTATIPVGKDPAAIAVGGGMVWVADPPTHTVVRIDPASNRVAARVTLDATPRDVAVEGSAVWIGLDHLLGFAESAVGLGRIDSKTNQLMATVPTPETFAGPIDRDVHVAIGGGIVWASSLGRVWQIDPATNSITRSVELEKEVADIVTQGDVAWVATFGTPGTVFRLEAVSGKVLDTIPAGGGSSEFQGSKRAMRLAVDDRNVWVTDGVNGTISRIVIVSGRVLSPTDLGKSPTGVAVGLGSVWVTVDGRSA
jgi:YVTN family beta-propeller protein